ncbi:amidohydrolase family protein [Gangjinia marincola]|uniref:Amidohydrolase family protein n=1 Tax=Gangjinia marincola TaxID=578463 RepID=A0ABN1MFJ2_9FLAO
MRRHLILFFTVALSTLVLSAQKNNSYALLGAQVFDTKSKDWQNKTILVENGLIKDLFEAGSKSIPDSYERLDLKGHYIIPGLIDTHVHLGMKGLSKSPEAARKELKKWIYSGVTAVRDMGGDARALAVENKRIKSGEQAGPTIYYSATVGSSDMIAKDLRLKRVTQGIGIENAGYIIEAKTGMNIEKEIAKAIASDVSGVKFYAGIKSDLIKAITDEAHKKGIQSWAHLTVFPDRPIEVVKAGVDVVSHVWGAFWQDNDVDPSKKIPFTHTDFKDARSATFPEDMSVIDSSSNELNLLFEAMRERNVIWDLTYVVPNPTIQKMYKDVALTASKAGVVFSTGTDYFNRLEEPFPAVFTQIERLVQDGILSTEEVLIAATLNGAKAIGIEKSHGTIEIGKVADLVILTKNPVERITNISEIKFTMKDGKTFYRENYEK